MNSEELYIKNAENGIRSIKLGNKTPKDANVGISLNKLKTLNIGMYDDLFKKYKDVLLEYKKRNHETE